MEKTTKKVNYTTKSNNSPIAPILNSLHFAIIMLINIHRISASFQLSVCSMKEEMPSPVLTRQEKLHIGPSKIKSMEHNLSNPTAMLN